MENKNVRRSQKVLGNGFFGRYDSGLMGRSLELYELLVEVFVQDEYGGDVVAPVAVVGC